jgi:hypothetical protein
MTVDVILLACRKSSAVKDNITVYDFFVMCALRSLSRFRRRRALH